MNMIIDDTHAEKILIWYMADMSAGENYFVYFILVDQDNVQRRLAESFSNLGILVSALKHLTKHGIWSTQHL